MVNASRSLLLVVGAFVLVQVFTVCMWMTDSKRQRTARELEHSDGVLLTLFTTMKPDERRSVIHLRTLRQAAALRPRVQPVLMVQEHDPWTTRVAEQLGWAVVHLEEPGVPRIREMFKKATSMFDSAFYGFTNADILFDSGLVHTLEALEKYEFPDGLMVIGRRHNIKAEELSEESSDTLSHLQTQAEIFGPDAQDYFITTKEGFPWGRVPDLVIGRPGYDNWLVTQALVWGINLIDATNTVLAVHQTGSDGNKAGTKASDRCVNRDLVGPYNYDAGRTFCAKLKTEVDFNNNIHVVKRHESERPSLCSHNDIGYAIDLTKMTPAPKSNEEIDQILYEFFPSDENPEKGVTLPWLDKETGRKTLVHLIDSLGGMERLSKLTYRQKEWLMKKLMQGNLLQSKDVNSQKNPVEDNMNKKIAVLRQNRGEKNRLVPRKNKLSEQHQLTARKVTETPEFGNPCLY